MSALGPRAPLVPAGPRPRPVYRTWRSPGIAPHHEWESYVHPDALAARAGFARIVVACCLEVRQYGTRIVLVSDLSDLPTLFIDRAYAAAHPNYDIVLLRTLHAQDDATIAAWWELEEETANGNP